MPITYADGRIRYVNEDKLAVAFARDSNQADGSIAGKQYLNLQAGGWDNEFDPARHLRKMAADAGVKHSQSFAAPDDFLIQPQGFAEIFVLDSDDAVVSLYAVMDSNEAYSRLRRWASRP